MAGQGTEEEQGSLEEQLQPEQVLIAEGQGHSELPVSRSDSSGTKPQFLHTVLSMDEDPESPPPPFETLGSLLSQSKMEFPRGLVRSVETLATPEETSSKTQEVAPQAVEQPADLPVATASVENFDEPMPEVYQDPFEVSLKYMEKHSILQIFQARRETAKMKPPFGKFIPQFLSLDLVRERLAGTSYSNQDQAELYLNSKEWELFATMSYSGFSYDRSASRQAITENLVYEKPDNPLEFMLKQIQAMIEARKQHLEKEEQMEKIRKGS